MGSSDCEVAIPCFAHPAQCCVHPVQLGILSSWASCPVGHPVQLGILSSWASCPVAHPVQLRILSSCASRPVAHPVQLRASRPVLGDGHRPSVLE
ncbi:hypothetical protein L873DRAFT_358176 [Choiromyces venosus 120613-1]|uniref:Hydrophobin n=1 Tax=Choiromyces venosus 120613-1 TaxID=1336337 RepID=A0A3N4J1K7_9PEZI|nr:hypothetical protein L873DRAFT_358176 [Choiromyces venosus 120613-1]